MGQATDPNKPKRSPDFLRYTGLGLQMVVTIGAAAWAGSWMDQRLNLKFPAFLMSFVLISFVGSLYQLYKALNKS